MPPTIVPPQEATEVRGWLLPFLRSLQKAKRLAPIPLLMLALLGTAALRFDGALVAEELRMNTVTMPIEIMGQDGHIEQVSIDVSNPSGVDSMYIVGHALGYHNSPALWEGTIERDEKASYRVNGGAWLPISNDNANVRFPERTYMGIGGAFHTLRLTVPVSNIVGGANTIEFRFNGTEGVSSGYRILELDLLGPGGVSRIGNTTFLEEDPETWEAPVGYGSPSDVTAGEQWWTQRNSLKASPLPGSSIIVASCSDCHAYSGFDLKYFNYSNTSIVERSQFHGLTEEQGNQIAAYIRQVELDRTDGRETSPYARPWNPPYQPGPSLTDRGEDDFTAGAGYEAVLDSDDEMPSYLFPDVGGNVPNTNPSREDMRGAMHLGSFYGADEDAWGNRLNYQNIPIAIQYPDWNNWLPDIHPFDSFGYNDFTATDLWQYHNDMYDRLDTPSEVGDEIDEFREWFVGESVRNGIEEIFQRVNYEFDDFPGQNSYDISYSTNPSGYHLGKQGLMAWEAVKTWEVLSRNKLQDLGDDMFGGLVTPEPWVGVGDPLRAIGSRATDDPPYFWPGSQAIVFDLSPHKHGDGSFPDEGSYGPPGTALLQFYFSTAWYDVQLLISREQTGVQDQGGGSPIDWSYQDALLGDLERSSDVSNFWRRLRSRVYAVQTHNNYWMMRRTGNGGMGSFAGQDPHVNNFFEIFGLAANPSGTIWTGNNTADETLARAATEEFLNELFEFRASVPVLEWARGGDGYQPNTYSPTAYGGNPPLFNYFAWADNVYRLLPILQAWGTRESLVSDIAHWGESMWPNGNWEQWYSSADDPPETTLTSPSNGQVFVAPASISLKANVSPGDAPVVRVEFYADGTLVGTDQNSPYETTMSNVGIGTYVLTAIAFDTNGLQGPSVSVSVTVEQQSTAPPTVMLTQPANGRVYVAPATFTFAAEALPGDAPIARVEFYSGQTLVLTDTSAPYGGSISGVEVGTYVLKAKAIDQNDNVGESAPVAVSVVEATGENNQFIPLLPGWNLISTYIDPKDPDLVAVLAGIIDFVTVVVDGDGNLFIPGSEINDIGTWRVGEGYQIFVTDAVTLEIVGQPLNPAATAIPLGQGWNQSAYLRNSGMLTSEALGSIAGQLVVVKDGFGRVYIPDLEIDQIGDMLPGQGYKMYVSASSVLLYPPNEGGLLDGGLFASRSFEQRLIRRNTAQVPPSLARVGNTESAGLPPLTSFVYGGYAAASTATLVLNISDMLEGYLVGVRTASGDIVGEAVIRDGRAIVSVLGEDPLDPDGTSGASEGDELDVYVLGTDGQELEQYTLVEPFDLLRGREISTPIPYGADGLWLASMQAGSVGDEGDDVPGTIELSATNYPNPFSQTTTIAYSLDRTADVELRIVDILGRHVATLVSKIQEPGTYQAVFDPSQLASGIYFYHLRANNQMHTGHMTLAR